MKKVMQALLCAGMCLLGYHVITTESSIDVSMPHGTLTAATVSNETFNGQNGFATASIPEDILRDAAKRFENKPDTVVIHDSIPVINVECKTVRPTPESTTDTIYMPLYMPNAVDGVSVKNRSPGHAEKQSVVLSVDGQVVYDSDEP